MRPFLPFSAVLLSLLPLLSAACAGSSDSPPTEPAGGAECADAGADGSVEPTEVTDFLSPSRLLRRVTLTLRGTPPTALELDALDGSGDEEAQKAYIDGFIEQLLTDPAFYRTMVDLGSEWISAPPIANQADQPEYIALQQVWLKPCDPGTLHAGALAPYYGIEVCEDAAAAETDVEPWWAEGTSVKVVGQAGNPSAEGTDTNQPIDCGETATTWSGFQGDCGCGPNLIYCHVPGYWQPFLFENPEGQRRLLWEEASRLFAHIAWHDRPLTDIVTGSYSVGPVDVQAAYVRLGRRNGATALDGFEGWWRASKWSAPADPEHSASDAKAWSEFEVSTRNPYFLSERDYHFDPRTEAAGSMKGIPAAGALTMIGSLGGYTRERVRGARFLEIFACEKFVPPPATQEFSAYTNDPATGGPCQHCHVRIDPAAIHFKRFDRVGNPGGTLLLPGIGRSVFPEAWTTGDYPYGGDPFDRWKRLWIADTRMTPVDASTAAANPESRFIDFLPPDQTLLGATSDGTVGPLGFGKLIVASGAFDRCAVRKLHERIVGRSIDPTTENGYLESLAEQFVADGRKVRPFVKALMNTETFRRGL
jgi:hypothetical protein